MRYGCPLVVRSDGGREFMGEFDAMMKTYKITHITTSPYYPQSNGLIERLNRVIKDKLQSLYNSKEYRDNWVNQLQIVAFAIRIAKSRATGFSPFEIMYGRDCQLPGPDDIHQDSFEN